MVQNFIVTSLLQYMLLFIPMILAREGTNPFDGFQPHKCDQKVLSTVSC